MTPSEIRHIAEHFNKMARSIFMTNRADSTPETPVVVPFFFVIDAKGITAVPPAGDKDQHAAAVRSLIKPSTLAVISVTESFMAKTDTIPDGDTPVRTLPGAKEMLVCITEMHDGPTLVMQQDIDRSGPLPSLGEVRISESHEHSGRFANWFAQ